SHGFAGDLALPSFPTRRSSDLRARVEADRHRPVLPPSHRGRRSPRLNDAGDGSRQPRASGRSSWWVGRAVAMRTELRLPRWEGGDRKSTRLNFSHRPIAYALFY